MDKLFNCDEDDLFDLDDEDRLSNPEYLPGLENLLNFEDPLNLDGLFDAPPPVRRRDDGPCGSRRANDIFR
jgi:hypothetical protein